MIIYLVHKEGTACTPPEPIDSAYEDLIKADARAAELKKEGFVSYTEAVYLYNRDGS